MAEIFKRIYPGNWVNHISAYPLPGPDFKGAPGDPQDRQQQAILFAPGWLAVHKVGVVHINTPPPTTGATVVGYDITLPSVDARADDKPRPDIKGLWIPPGVQLYRLGLRVPSFGDQAAFMSSGPKDLQASKPSGLKGQTGCDLWLDTVAAPAAAPGATATQDASAGTFNTKSYSVGANGDFLPGEVVSQLADPFAAAATVDPAGGGLTVKLFADAGGVGTTVPGGIYLVAEACYLMPDPHVAQLANVVLPGNNYSGYNR